MRKIKVLLIVTTIIVTIIALQSMALATNDRGREIVTPDKTKHEKELPEIDNPVAQDYTAKGVVSNPDGNDSISEAVTLTVGANNNLTLEGNDTDYYKFIPEVTAGYRFYDTDGNWLDYVLYDEAFNLIGLQYFSDDISGYQIAESLTQGNTYYLRVYQSSGSATYGLVVEQYTKSTSTAFELYVGWNLNQYFTYGAYSNASSPFDIDYEFDTCFVLLYEQNNAIVEGIYYDAACTVKAQKANNYDWQIFLGDVSSVTSIYIKVASESDTVTDVYQFNITRATDFGYWQTNTQVGEIVTQRSHFWSDGELIETENFSTEGAITSKILYYQDLPTYTQFYYSTGIIKTGVFFSSTATPYVEQRDYYSSVGVRNNTAEYYSDGNKYSNTFYRENGAIPYKEIIYDGTPQNNVLVARYYDTNGIQTSERGTTDEGDLIWISLFDSEGYEILMRSYTSGVVSALYRYDKSDTIQIILYNSVSIDAIALLKVDNLYIIRDLYPSKVCAEYMKLYVGGNRLELDIEYREDGSRISVASHEDTNDNFMTQKVLLNSAGQKTNTLLYSSGILQSDREFWLTTGNSKSLKVYDNGVTLKYEHQFRENGIKSHILVYYPDGVNVKEDKVFDETGTYTHSIYYDIDGNEILAP